MISVCMATYNGGRYLIEQIDSILPQLGSSDELIISDDGSSDQTLELIRSYMDDRIKVFEDNPVRGYSRNFQNALEHSSGEYIFLCDQDDIWESDKVSECMRELANFDFVVHDAKMVTSDKEIINGSYFQFRSVKKGFIQNFYKIGYLGCCMAFRRSVYLKAKPFPFRKNYITHDSWLTLVSELYFSTSLVYKPLISYRRHSSNASSGGADEGNSPLTKILIRVYSGLQLFKYLFK